MTVNDQSPLRKVILSRWSLLLLFPLLLCIALAASQCRPAPPVTGTLPPQSSLLAFTGRIQLTPFSTRHDLYILETESGKLWEWSEQLNGGGSLDWSVAQQQLLIQGDYKERRGAYLIPVNGTVQGTLLPKWSSSVYSWSPDGKQIALSYRSRSDSYTTDLYIYDTERMALRQLTFLPPRAEVFNVDWSPTGEDILFDVYNSDARTTDLFIIKADGSDVRKIRENGRDPQWSPDGHKIAFRYPVGPGQALSLAVMDPDGSNTELVIDADDMDIAREGVYAFTWSSSGQALFFAACSQRSFFYRSGSPSLPKLCFKHLYELELDNSQVQRLSSYPFTSLVEMTHISEREP